MSSLAALKAKLEKRSKKNGDEAHSVDGKDCEDSDTTSNLQDCVNLESADEYWENRLQEEGSKPNVWQDYVEYLKKTHQEDEFIMYNKLCSAYDRALKVVSSEANKKNGIYARLWLNYANLKSKYNIDEEEIILDDARCRLRKFAVVHIACAEFRTKQGQFDKAKKLLQKAKLYDAEPVQLIQKALQHVDDGCCILITDEEREAGLFTEFTNGYNSEDSNIIEDHHASYFELKTEEINTAPLPTADHHSAIMTSASRAAVRHYKSTPSCRTKSLSSNPFSTNPFSAHKWKRPGKSSLGPPMRVKLNLPASETFNLNEAQEDNTMNSFRPLESFNKSSNEPSAAHSSGYVSSCTHDLTNNDTDQDVDEPDNSENSEKLLIPVSHSTTHLSPDKHLDLSDGPLQSPVKRQCTEKQSSSSKEALQSPIKRQFTEKQLNSSDESLHSPNKQQCTIKQSNSSEKQLQSPVKRLCTDKQSISSNELLQLPVKQHYMDQQSNSSDEPLLSPVKQLCMDEHSNSSDEPLQLPVKRQCTDEQSNSTDEPLHSPVKQPKHSDSSNVSLPQIDQPCTNKLSNSFNKPLQSLIKLHCIDKQIESANYSNHSSNKQQCLQDGGRNSESENNPEPKHLDVNSSVKPPQNNPHIDLNNSVKPNIDSRIPEPVHVLADVNAKEGSKVTAQPNISVPPGASTNVQKVPEIVKPVMYKVPVEKVKPVETVKQNASSNVKQNLPLITAPTPIKAGCEVKVINGKSYTLLKVAGRGGSAKVYQVLDEKNNVRALKCVDLDCANDIIIEGYKNEINLLKRLQYCDAVIKMYDFEFDDDRNQLNVILEYGETDLAVHLSGKKRGAKHLGDAIIKFYWHEMLSAVNALHKEGIIHSDLKPANFIFVAANLKLIDFGIADAVQQDKTSVFREVTAGTVSYMSPEAIKESCDIGAKYKISVRSDVWSLGCILYNIVYGRTPFQHIRHQAARIQAITDDKHIIAFPDIPDKNLLDVLKKCLIRDFRKRPTTEDLLNHPYLSQKQTEESPVPQTIKHKTVQTILDQISEFSPRSIQQTFQGLVQKMGKSKLEEIQNQKEGVELLNMDQSKPSRQPLQCLFEAE